MLISYLSQRLPGRESRSFHRQTKSHLRFGIVARWNPYGTVHHHASRGGYADLETAPSERAKVFGPEISSHRSASPGKIHQCSGIAVEDRRAPVKQIREASVAPRAYPSHISTPLLEDSSRRQLTSTKVAMLAFVPGFSSILTFFSKKMLTGYCGV